MPAKDPQRKKETDKASYLRHREERIEKMREYRLTKKGQDSQKRGMEKRVTSKAAFFREVKKAGCSVCGEKEPVCLDFHHKNPKTKKFSVSHYRGSYHDLELQREIKKCILLCANCHRKLHARILMIEGVSNAN